MFIKPNNVIMVGCGGIGYYLAPLLARHIGTTRTKLILVDGDSIEEKNTARVFGMDTVGENKAYALKNILKAQLPKLDVEAHGIYFDSSPECYAGLVDNLVSGPVVLAGCVDNAKTRLMMQTFAEKMRGDRVIRYVDGGNNLTSGQSFLFAGDPYSHSETIDQVFPDLTTTQDIQDRHPNDIPCTAVYESEPQQATTNSFVANLMMAHLVMSETLPTEALKNIMSVDFGKENPFALVYREAPRELSKDEFAEAVRDLPVLS